MIFDNGTYSGCPDAYAYAYDVSNSFYVTKDESISLQ
jgi:hypothetical protein